MLARVEPASTAANPEITTPMAQVPLMLTTNPFFPGRKLEQSARVSAGSAITASPALPWGISHTQLSPFRVQGVCKHE